MDLDPFRSPAFMAVPGELADWRLVLVYDAARTTGLLAALPGSAEELAARCALAPTAVRVVGDALCAAEVLQRDEAGVYSWGRFAPGDGADVQLHQHATTLRRWATSIEARLRGEELPQRGVSQLRDWLEAMAVHAAGQADAVADAALAPLAQAPSTVVRALDLGGGHGRYAAALAARRAHVVLLDRPEVIAVVREQGWLDGTGVELVPGDFHEALPDGPFDVVLAVGVMHTMAPERAASLLARVAARTRPGGVLLIRTMLRNEGPTSALFAVQMLVAGLGGDAHRLEDYQRWLADAGFDQPELTGIGSGATLVCRRR